MPTNPFVFHTVTDVLDLQCDTTFLKSISYGDPSYKSPWIGKHECCIVNCTADAILFNTGRQTNDQGNTRDVILGLCQQCWNKHIGEGVKPNANE